MTILLRLKPLHWRAFLGAQAGATAVEYALMIALIALVIFGGVYLLGPNLDLIFDEAAASL